MEPDEQLDVEYLTDMVKRLGMVSVIGLLVDIALIRADDNAAAAESARARGHNKFETARCQEQNDWENIASELRKAHKQADGY